MIDSNNYIIFFRKSELLLLGEISKWIAMSPQRVTKISFNHEDFNVFLQGASGETVVFYYVHKSKADSLKCVLSKDGTAWISLADKKCYAD